MDGSNTTTSDRPNGLGGFTVFVDVNGDTLNNDGFSAVTATDGTYTITGIPVGTYTVYEVAQSGYTVVIGSVSNVSVTSGGNTSGVDFANFENVNIVGGPDYMKFEDRNGNGVQDSGDDGLDGWTIELYRESNGLAGFQSDELYDSTVTDADGYYSFSNLIPGSYFVREVNQSGWTQTYGAGGYTFTASSGEPPPAMNFGNFENVTLRGVKFYDANTNGDRDTGEPKISGWQVGIDVNGDNVADYFTVTGADGSYVFGDLDNADGDNNPLTGSDLGPNATFVIIEGSSTNWVATTPTSVNITVGGAGVQSGGEGTANFGNVKLGTTGGKTIGFWSNKNGQAAFNTDTSGNLAGLVGLNLRTATGGHFDPGNYAAFRSWLLNATATNMSYMLSAQYAGAWLNVNALGVSDDTLIHVGTLSLWSGNVQGASLAGNLGGLVSPTGFVRLGDVMTAANALLGTNGHIPAGNPLRAFAEALKVVLDGFNNNLSIAVVGLDAWDDDDNDGVIDLDEI